VMCRSGTDMTIKPPLLRIEALSKTYSGAGRPALMSVDLDIQRGSCLGLLGPNGAGKTTLISILTGTRRADGGAVRLLAESGHWINCGADFADAAPLIGLVPQELAFYPTLTVRDNLAFFGAMHGLKGTALRGRLAAGAAIGRLSEFLDRRAETLSGGLQRRLNLAIGLMHNPVLLVLDEPAVGIDAQSRLFVLEELCKLKAAGTTIIYASHYLDEVQQICDSLAIIDHGRIIAQGLLVDLLKDDLVTLRLAEAPSAQLLQALNSLPAVTGVRQADMRLALLN
jgi:ABC-2 type transport system ATP-binding protein